MMAAILAMSAVIIALLAVSAVFSAAETALTGASRGRMHQLEREGDRAAKRVNRLLSDQRDHDRRRADRLQRDQYPQFRPGDRIHRPGRAGRLGRRPGDGHHDRAGGGVRRGAAQDPRHRSRRRCGAGRIGAHAPGGQGPGTRSFSPSSGSCATPFVCSASGSTWRPTSWRRTRKSAARWNTTIPKAAWKAATGACWAACSTSPAWTSPISWSTASPCR